MSEPTAGGIKVLTCAVKALIETHPDKDAFRARFLELANAERIEGGGRALEDLLKSASTSPGA